MQELETDVLIAGGGPCGLMLANELGRRGIRTLLVDTKPGTAFNPQANATQARTMEHFRRLGFAHEVRAQGLPADHPTDIAYFTRYTGRELARLSLPTAGQAVRNVRGMGGSWSAAELPHRVSQKFVEAILRRHAQGHASNDIRYGWRLEEFEDTGEEVRAVVCPHLNPLPDGQGGSQRVRAKYLVGADGPRSFVRSTLGIAWGGGTGVRRDFMGGVMFAVYLRAPRFYAVFPHAQAWMYVTVNAQRRAFMASVDGQSEFAFHAAVHEGEDPERWTEGDARRVFAQALGREIPIEVLSFGTWTAGHSLVAQTFHRGRVFIAGDAAHLFTPTGGLGYNTAVEDAVNLAWKLASAVRGRNPPALLDSYEIERKPLAVRNTGYARHFADSVGLFPARPDLELEGPAGEAARREASLHLNAHVRLEFNIPGVTFGGRYERSPLIVAEAGLPPADEANQYVPTARPGGRPPHAWLEDGRSLFDSFHPEWTLLALGPQVPSTAAFEHAAQALGMDLRVVRHPAPALCELYEAPLALVRPDQIVAWRGSHARGAERILRKSTGFSW
ncbi:FAD-dependent oxidoreductase [Ramlibacter monticola]|uniref:FAD-dependent oxidoreductase n=1 Tax=Ramlibacter monticola TaxID=1926872 RepID=A0A936Z1P2_9BURK|nr:FAD-dependent oxidoreductase [Ramlibacter monticola]MBL0393350.1 FAD-dependent oxidoreductase [Ramlibacter monticola]